MLKWRNSLHFPFLLLFSSFWVSWSGRLEFWIQGFHPCRRNVCIDEGFVMNSDVLPRKRGREMNQLRYKTHHHDQKMLST